MSELSRLLGKPEEVEIGGVVFKIKPLTVADLDLIGSMDSDKPNPEVLKKLVEKTLRDSFPDATDEEVNGFPLEHMNALSEAIAKVNKFKTDDAESEIRKRLKSATK